MARMYLFDEITPQRLASAAQCDPELAGAVHGGLVQVLERLIAADMVLVSPGWYFGATGDPEAEEYLGSLAWQLAELAEEHDDFSFELDDYELEKALGGREVAWSADVTRTIADDLDLADDAVWPVVEAFCNEVRRLSVDGAGWAVEADRLPSERSFEAWLVQHLDVVGDWLDMPELCFHGRQGRLEGGAHIVDILCRNGDDLIVVELKAGHADVEAVEQLNRYLDAVERELLGDGPGGVGGVLISMGTSARCRRMIAADPRLVHLPITWLGYPIPAKSS